MKLNSNLLFIIFSLSGLLSCTKENNNETLQLLPMPQNVEVNRSQKLQLKNGELAPSVISIKNVSSIPEASINQEEAYRLIVTSDSVIIEATDDKGLYWANQTLNQLILQAKNSQQSIPGVVITDWPAFRVRGFMHDVGRSYISVEELKKTDSAFVAVQDKCISLAFN